MSSWSVQRNASGQSLATRGDSLAAKKGDLIALNLRALDAHSRTAKARPSNRPTLTSELIFSCTPHRRPSEFQILLMCIFGITLLLALIGRACFEFQIARASNMVNAPTVARPPARPRYTRTFTMFSPPDSHGNHMLSLTSASPATVLPLGHEPFTLRMHGATGAYLEFEISSAFRNR